MDITIYLLLIAGIVLLFVLMKYSLNVFLYAGIIVLSCLGLIMMVEDGASIHTGSQAVITHTPDTTVTVVPITTDLGIWSYVINLTFITFIIGAVVFWTLDNPKEMEN